VTAAADDRLLAALRALAGALRELHAPAMVIGGIAVIARGVPRQTVDIDAAVWGEGLDVDGVAAVLGRHDLIPRIDDALAFARERQVLLVRHGPSGTPVDVSFAWLPFERAALDRAEPFDFAGVVIPVAQPEDLVVYKAVAWRERDRSDIERLLLRHAGVVDLDRVRGLVRQFADALDEPERVDQFEALVRRALGR
jgi:hypothetical protein